MDPTPWKLGSTWTKNLLTGLRETQFWIEDASGIHIALCFGKDDKAQARALRIINAINTEVK